MKRVFIICIIISLSLVGCNPKSKEISQQSEIDQTMTSLDKIDEDILSVETYCDFLERNSDNKITVSTLSEKERTDLAKALSKVIRSQLSIDIPIQIRCFPFSDNSSMQILIRHTEMARDDFAQLGAACDFFSTELENSNQIELIFCNPDEWDKNVSLSQEELVPEIYWKLTDSALFSIDTRILPNSTSLANALYSEFSRKKELVETLGDLITVSDTEVVTEIKKLFESKGSFVIIRASLLEDEVMFAVNFSDFEDLTKYELLEEARKLFSEAIGKEAGVRVYYYSNSQWQEKLKAIEGLPMCRLKLEDITTSMVTEHTGGNDSLLESLQHGHFIMKVNSIINFDS